MKLYADTELDTDIRNVREMFSRCCTGCHNIGEIVSKLNKTFSGRICVILSLFKILSSTQSI